jgi:hypothetical protein
MNADETQMKRGADVFTCLIGVNLCSSVAKHRLDRALGRASMLHHAPFSINRRIFLATDEHG